MRKKHSSWQWQALTSTISTTMVLVLLGLVVIFVLTAKKLSESVRENLTVTVVLQDDASTQDAKKLMTELSQKAYVNEIEYISSEQALNEQIEAMGLDPTEFLGTNPFSISMELKMKAHYACNDSLLWISKELSESKLVSDVMYQKDLVDNLNENLQRVSLILLVFAGLLIIVSLSLINNTVRLSVYSRRFIIHTMKLVGASWGFIRRPFVKQALLVGVIAAFVAIAVLGGCFYGLWYYEPNIINIITWKELTITGVAVLLLGILITVICSYISVNRFLKMTPGELYKI